MSVPLVNQFVTAMTVAEIEPGVAVKERSDPAQGHVLRRWFEQHVLPAFADRILPFDLPAARVLASYRVPEHAPWGDALLAATAQSVGLTIATRNVKHFMPLGVSCVDPWDVGSGGR